MKKLFLMVAIATFMVACSTNEEEIFLPGEKVDVTFDADYEDVTDAEGNAIEATRAYADGLTPRWEVGDQVGLYYQKSDDTYAQVNGSVTECNNGHAKINVTFTDPKNQTHIWAGYAPNGVTLTNDGSGMHVESAIPATQNGTAKLILAANTELRTLDGRKQHLRFYHNAAYLHISGAGLQGCTKVVLQASNSQHIAGKYWYNFTNSKIVADSLKTNTITANIPNGSTNITMTLPAINLTKGYVLAFYKGSQIMVKSYGYNSGKNEARGSYHNVSVPTFTPLTATIDMSHIYTSYDRYVSQGAAAANALDGNRIYAETIPVTLTGVSNTVRSMMYAGYAVNNHYYDGMNHLTISATGVTPGNWGGYAYIKTGANSVKLEVKIGSLVLDSRTVTKYISHLPYSSDTHYCKNDGYNYGWYEENGHNAYVTTVTNRMQIGASGLADHYTAVYDFYTPNNIQITAYTTNFIVKSGIHKTVTGTFGIGSTPIFETQTTKTYDEHTYNMSAPATVTLPANDAHARIRLTYTFGASCIKVHHVEYKYAE